MAVDRTLSQWPIITMMQHCPSQIVTTYILYVYEFSTIVPCHIMHSNIVESGYVLHPVKCNAITLSKAGLLAIGPLGINPSEMLSKMLSFPFKQNHMKMPTAESTFLSRLQCAKIKKSNLSLTLQLLRLLSFSLGQSHPFVLIRLNHTQCIGGWVQALWT